MTLALSNNKTDRKESQLNNTLAVKYLERGIFKTKIPTALNQWQESIRTATRLFKAEVGLGKHHSYCENLIVKRQKSNDDC